MVKKEDRKFKVVNRVEESKIPTKVRATHRSKSDKFAEFLQKEIDSFNHGEKRVAIISDASATGISLHCRENTDSSTNPRAQIIAELSWSADRVLQVLGRVNRSGQACKPEYWFVESDHNSERRFTSTIRGRLHSMVYVISLLYFNYLHILIIFTSCIVNWLLGTIKFGAKYLNSR